MLKFYVKINAIDNQDYIEGKLWKSLCRGNKKIAPAFVDGAIFLCWWRFCCDYLSREVDIP